MQRFKDYSDAAILSVDDDKNKAVDIPLMIVGFITDLLTRRLTRSYFPSDFSDIRHVLFNSGTAFLGTGYAENESNIETAVRNAVKMWVGIIK